MQVLDSSSRVEMEITVLTMVVVLVMVLTSIIDSLGHWHCLLGLYMDWSIGVVSVRFTSSMNH
jgi:hypothetical protein